jgi:vacuolar-type H+-ATPase subunit I/STV1
MTLKNAAFFALIGMILLTVLLAVGFIRDVSAILVGAIAAIALLKSLIQLLASLGVTVFLFVFHRAQS